MCALFQKAAEQISNTNIHADMDATTAVGLWEELLSSNDPQHDEKPCAADEADDKLAGADDTQGSSQEPEVIDALWDAICEEADSELSDQGWWTEDALLSIEDGA